MANNTTSKRDLQLLIGAGIGLLVGAVLGWIIGTIMEDRGRALYVSIPIGIGIGLAIASRLDQQKKKR